MKDNRFKAVRTAGKVPVGHMISEFPSAALAGILDVADVDFALVDMEHAGLTAERLADFCAWFRGSSVAPFVRVPQLQYHFIARALDLGVLGVMMPNVRNAAQAREFVHAAKYAPMGDRGLGLGSAHSGFRPMPDPVAYMAYANENTTLICQIESREAVEDLENIAATPGVDVIWVGHWDLSQSYGIPGQFDNPIFLDAVKRVVEVGQKHNLGIGVQPANLTMAERWMGYGFNVISYRTDAALYQEAITTGVAGVRKLAEK